MRLRTTNTGRSSAFFRHLAVLFIGLNLIGFTAQARESNLESVDPYVILGVESNATKAEIREAWSRLVQANHPDALGEDNAHIRTINDAYQLLKDDARRLAYDTGELDFNGHIRENDFQVSDREKTERERVSWNQFFQAAEPKVRKLLNERDPSLNNDSMVVLYGILSMPMTGADGQNHGQPRLLTPGHRKAYGQMLERLGLMNDMSTRDKRLICDRDPIEAIDAIFRQDLIDRAEVKEAFSILKAFEIFYVDQDHAREDFLNLVKILKDKDFMAAIGIDKDLRRALTPTLQHYVNQIKSSGCKTARCVGQLAQAKIYLNATQSLSEKAASCLRALIH